MLTVKDRTYSEQIRSFLVSNFYVSDVKARRFPDDALHGY